MRKKSKPEEPTEKKQDCVMISHPAVMYRMVEGKIESEKFDATPDAPAEIPDGWYEDKFKAGYKK